MNKVYGLQKMFEKVRFNSDSEKFSKIDIKKILFSEKILFYKFDVLI